MTTACEPSPYFADLQNMLDPFLQAVSFAKQLGNICVRPQFDLLKLYDILSEEVEELLDAELSKSPHKSRADEFAVVIKDMNRIMNVAN